MSADEHSKVCAVDQCSRKASAKGLCVTHRRQQRAGKQFSLLKILPPGVSLCSFEGCGSQVSSLGLCRAHWDRQRSGRPLIPIKHHRRPGTDPVITYVEVPCPREDLEGPCHVYDGYKVGGYGRVRADGRDIYVHRYVWERLNGPVPSGMMLDHQCRVRSCCSVKHLRVVTQQVNATENVVGSGWQLSAAKTHCPQGHEYSKENTYRSRKGKRHCWTCLRANRLKTTAKRRIARELRLQQQA